MQVGINPKDLSGSRKRSASDEMPPPPPKRQNTEQAKLNRTQYGAGCGNCAQRDHQGKDCVGPTDRDGTIPVCGWCNLGPINARGEALHLTEMCSSLGNEVARHRRLGNLLIRFRQGKVPLKSAMDLQKLLNSDVYQEFIQDRGLDLVLPVPRMISMAQVAAHDYIGEEAARRLADAARQLPQPRMGQAIPSGHMAHWPRSQASNDDGGYSVHVVKVENEELAAREQRAATGWNDNADSVHAGIKQEPLDQNDIPFQYPGLDPRINGSEDHMDGAYFEHSRLDPRYKDEIGYEEFTYHGLDTASVVSSHPSFSIAGSNEGHCSAPSDKTLKDGMYATPRAPSNQPGVKKDKTDWDYFSSVGRGVSTTRGNVPPRDRGRGWRGGRGRDGGGRGGEGDEGGGGSGS